MGNKEKVDVQKVISDIVVLEGLLDMYKLDNYCYFMMEQGLQVLVIKFDIVLILKNYCDDGYICCLLEDLWGNDYILVSLGEYGVVDVFFVGLDVEVNIVDDIINWFLDKKEK